MYTLQKHTLSLVYHTFHTKSSDHEYVAYDWVARVLHSSAFIENSKKLASLCLLNTICTSILQMLAYKIVVSFQGILPLRMLLDSTISDLYSYLSYILIFLNRFMTMFPT